MLDDDAIETIAGWLRRSGGAGEIDRIVPPAHPSRAWIHDDVSAEGVLTELVRVLANGGHLPLVAALVLAAQGRGPELPLPASRALAAALSAWDESACRAAAARSGIFVCYAHEDAARVERIVRVLRGASLEVFRDTDSIPLGESIAASVARAIDACYAAVVVVSEASAASQWVSREVALLMQGASRIIVPVVIDDVPLPKTIGDHFAVDLRGLDAGMPAHVIDERLQPLIETMTRGADATGMLFQP